METKVSPIFFDSKKFLLFSDLPLKQAELFADWVKVTFKADKDLEAIEYDQYDFWFDHHFSAERNLDYMI